MDLINLDELPVLEGQLIPPMAAIALRRKRQRVDQMMRENKFKTAVRVAGSGGRAAAYLIKEAEIRVMAVENCPSCQYLKAHGQPEINVCDHFLVDEDGQVTLADILQVADETLLGDAEPVEHAAPFAVADGPVRA
jgi:hypothetical protein